MSGNRPSIVVIEDNSTDVFLIREAITARELDVDLLIYEDGEEALGYIGRLDEDESAPCPRLMLLDLNLPRTDGFEVLARVRNSKRCASMPVIVMTSSDTQSDRARSAALGADEYFRKPSEYDAFLEIADLIRNELKPDR